MRLPLKENEQKLLDLLQRLPPEYDKAACFINETGLTAEGVTKVAIRYVEECYCDADCYLSEHMAVDADVWDVKIPQDGLTDLHSSYIVDAIRFLLKYGLDPNAVFKTECGNHNIMFEIRYVDNGYLGVDALVLLLEHGGDPNLCIGGDYLFDDVCFDIWFGSVEQKARWVYDIWVHTWMVLVAFGGQYSEECDYPKLFEGYDEKGCYGKYFDIKCLKEHRNFYFGLSFEEGCRTVHIYDKETSWKVAEWR